MKVAAIIVALLALGCLSAAVWLLWVLWKFAGSQAYAPHSYVSFAYAAGALEADGGGIYMPAVLMLAVGGFLAKFALNLWRD